MIQRCSLTQCAAEFRSLPETIQTETDGISVPGVLFLAAAPLTAQQEGQTTYLGVLGGERDGQDGQYTPPECCQELSCKHLTWKNVSVGSG